MRTKLFSLAIIFLAFFSHSIKGQEKFVFPELPYSYDALESFIDKTTMEIHYSRHHKAYYNNFVKTLNECDSGDKSIEDLFANVSKHVVSIRNNGGGYYNHNLFWEIMSPDGGGVPKGELLKAIEKAFGSFEEFKNKFESAAKTQFGSGWAWLALDWEGNLFVSSTLNQDNPLMDVAEKRGTPILGLDVWEHAYYLHYQNKRGDYVSNFWKVVNWKAVEENYKDALRKIK
jgi:Fe-Mn family superoxide dismutase